MWTQNPISTTEIIFVSLSLFFYFAPALIAVWRNHRNGMSIFLTNLFFGWTVLGWLIALIWSASANDSAHDATTRGSSR